MIIKIHLLNLVGAIPHEHKFIIRLAQRSGFLTAALGENRRGAVGIQGEELKHNLATGGPGEAFWTFSLNRHGGEVQGS
jgi:hypothetical protein